MKILIAFPDIPYYNWQVLVQINNLVKFGFGNDIIYVVGKRPNVRLNTQIHKVLNDTSVEYYVYDDTRVKSCYPSSLRPHIIEKLFKHRTKLSNETIFYIDPDLLFSDFIDFDSLISGNTWYLSDTKSYIDSKYIKSKSKELFEEMCKIVGIDESLVTDNDVNAGGAQYLMKNVDANYWGKVFSNSEKLYNFMKKTEKKYSPQHPIQSWTADMWSVLWNGWKNNHNTKIISELNFSWATDPIEKYGKNKLFHNAGVAKQTNLFNKIAYQTSPFNADFSHVSNKYCSYKYVEEIEETKNNYPDLITLF